ncbi:hypothetical protein [uncultured Sphaerotilus sp.]
MVGLDAVGALGADFTGRTCRQAGGVGLLAQTRLQLELLDIEPELARGDG